MRAEVRRHRWVADACVRCGLRREEVWVLDAQRRPVTALVWSVRSGPMRVQAFAPMKGPAPDPFPTTTVDVRFPGIAHGPEPRCVERDRG